MPNRSMVGRVTLNHTIGVRFLSSAQNKRDSIHFLYAIPFILSINIYDKYENNLDNALFLWYNTQIGECELLCIHMANILKVVYHSEI